MEVVIKWQHVVGVQLQLRRVSWESWQLCDQHLYMLTLERFRSWISTIRTRFGIYHDPWERRLPIVSSSLRNVTVIGMIPQVSESVDMIRSWIRWQETQSGCVNTQWYIVNHVQYVSCNGTHCSCCRRTFLFYVLLFWAPMLLSGNVPSVIARRCPVAHLVFMFNKKHSVTFCWT